MTSQPAHPVEGDWIDIGAVEDVPRLGARVVRTAGGDIAVFRTATDACFALEDRCPHKQGVLSQGIVHGEAVTCPLHNWVIGLATGEAQGADEGATRTVALRLEGGRIYLERASLAGRTGR
jgi:nitrite reductase (NADH) small subunit